MKSSRYSRSVSVGSLTWTGGDRRRLGGRGDDVTPGQLMTSWQVPDVVAAAVRLTHAVAGALHVNHLCITTNSTIKHQITLITQLSIAPYGRNFSGVTCPAGSLLGNAAAGSRTRDLLIASPAPKPLQSAEPSSSPSSYLLPPPKEVMILLLCVWLLARQLNSCARIVVIFLRTGGKCDWQPLITFDNSDPGTT